ncbi:MAG TPA: SPOR domain-containing protein [Allosphingosinicella sp.]|nr:SPOR domain-containing protein [Allosphingosinicella sp.]
MGGLALVAAAGAVLASGALSFNLGGGPDPAFAAGIKQSVAGARPGREAQATLPAVRIPPPGAAPAPRQPFGVWQIQVGAFRNMSAAQADLAALESQVPELGRLKATHQLRGTINRVRIGGIEDEAGARRLCARLAEIGRGCFVAGPES